MFQQFKGIICDLDGVVVASEPFRLKTYEILFEQELGIKARIKPDTLVGRSEKVNLQYLLDLHGVSTTVDRLRLQRRELLLKAAETDIPVIPVVYSFIQKLKSAGIKTALATNSGKEYLEVLNQRFNLSDLFDVQLTADDVREPKPNPEIFLKALARMKLKPDQCVVLEDSPTGIDAAKKCGTHFIGVLSSYKKEDLKGALDYLSPEKAVPGQLLSLFGINHQKNLA